jgi:hypothetical protein
LLGSSSQAASWPGERRATKSYWWLCRRCCTLDMNMARRSGPIPCACYVQLSVTKINKH